MSKEKDNSRLVVIIVAVCILAAWLGLEWHYFHKDWTGGREPLKAQADVEALKMVLNFNNWQSSLVLGLFAVFGFLIGQSERSGLPASLLEAIALLALSFAFLFGVLIYYEVEFMFTEGAFRSDYNHLAHARNAQKLLVATGLLLFTFAFMSQKGGQHRP